MYCLTFSVHRNCVNLRIMVSCVCCDVFFVCCKQIPHVNVMSKLDLLNKEAKTKLERYLEPDMSAVLSEEMAEDEQLVTNFQKLNHALATLVSLSFLTDLQFFYM